MKKILMGISILSFFNHLSFGAIKLEDSTDLRIKMKLVGDLQISAPTLDFGRMSAGEKSYTTSGNLVISDTGESSNSPVKISFIGKDGKTETSVMEISNGKDKIPVYLSFGGDVKGRESSSKIKNLKNGALTEKITAHIKKIDKNFSEGSYNGIIKVRVVHLDG